MNKRCMWIFQKLKVITNSLLDRFKLPGKTTSQPLSLSEEQQRVIAYLPFSLPWAATHGHVMSVAPTVDSEVTLPQMKAPNSLLHEAVLISNGQESAVIQKAAMKHLCLRSKILDGKANVGIALLNWSASDVLAFIVRLSHVPWSSHPSREGRMNHFFHRHYKFNLNQN